MEWQKVQKEALSYLSLCCRYACIVGACAWYAWMYGVTSCLLDNCKKCNESCIHKVQQRNFGFGSDMGSHGNLGEHLDRVIPPHEFEPVYTQADIHALFLTSSRLSLLYSFADSSSWHIWDGSSDALSTTSWLSSEVIPALSAIYRYHLQVYAIWHAAATSIISNYGFSWPICWFTFFTTPDHVCKP